MYRNGVPTRIPLEGPTSGFEVKCDRQDEGSPTNRPDFPDCTTQEPARFFVDPTQAKTS